uniref:RRM domain-containing protein n=1 Tax=Oryza punctata TaxID=4537 RepID=A0A0E0MNN4_ORYPU
MGEGASEETGSMDRAKAAAAKETAVSRAVAEDDTALLLAAVGSFRKEAMGRLRKGSDASRMLDQEMSTRLLHLACKHDAVQCARLILEGGHGITASAVDARDQLTRTPLQVAAESHSARCVELLLSKNARTDLKLVDGRPLVALEIALLSRSAHVKWSLDNSIEDLLSSLQEKDLNAVRLLAEKTREVGEVAYRYAMEGRVTALAMLLLVAEEKISAPVSVVIEGVRTKKSIYYSLVDEALSMGDTPARDINERRKALLSKIQLLNQFGAALWRDRNIDKRSLPPLLKAAKVGDVKVTKMLLMGDVDVNEADPEGNTALHWIVWLLLKNGARVFQGNKLGLTPVHSAAAKGNYKALQSLLLHAQDCVDTPSKTKETPLFLAVKNGSLDCVKLLLRSGASTKVQNLRKQRPIDVATSQDMRFILTSANVAPWNRSSHPKKSAKNKESFKEFLEDFVDYDSDDLNESFTGLKTSASHRDFRSSNGSAQGGKSKNHCAPKQGSKFVPWPNHWPKHDYTRKIFVGGLPPSVGAEYLTEFFTAEFGPVEEAVVIGIRMSDRVQSRGFGFVKFKREEDVISAKETHHVYMLGKRVEVKDAVARGSLPAETQKTASFRHHNQEVPKVTNHLLDGELKEEHYIRKRRPLPEKCLPSWFFIFRKWLPGFLADATERLGDRYPLSSLKGDFRAICRMELDHGTLGYPKLSDFTRSLPGICRMCVVPVGSGPATHMVLLPPVSRLKYVPLLEPFSFDHDELPESVSDHQSPRSPLTNNITEDYPRNTNSQQGDTCSESNAQSHQGDECSGSYAESQQDSASTDKGSLLSEVTASTIKPYSADTVEPVPTRKPDLCVPEPTGQPNVIETVALTQKIISEPVRKIGLPESGLERTCFVDCPVETAIENEQIFVVGFCRQIPLQVDIRKPAKLMMQHYEEKTGTDPESQYYLYEGKVINPLQTLGHYGIGKEANVRACNRLLGGSGNTLEEYLNYNRENLVDTIELPDGSFYPELKPFALKVLKTLLKCFTEAFSNRKCWGENFTLKYFRVVDDHVEVIVEPWENLRSEFMTKHFDNLVRNIKRFFCKKGPGSVTEYPPYIDDLCTFLLSLHSPVLLPVDKIFIETHISCVCKLKGIEHLSEVAIFRNIIAKGVRDNKPYALKNSGGFRLSRDLIIHILEYQTDPLVIRFQNGSGLELMIPAHLKDLLPKIIKCFMDEQVDITEDTRNIIFSHYSSGCSKKRIGSSTSENGIACASTSTETAQSKEEHQEPPVTEEEQNNPWQTVGRKGKAKGIMKR